MTPNKVTIFQFTNKEDFEAGVQSIKSSLPKAAVYDHYPLVIAATGPDREANLAAVELPLPLISQHLPAQYARVRRGELLTDPRDLVIDHVRDVLRVYARACDPGQRATQPP